MSDATTLFVDAIEAHFTKLKSFTIEEIRSRSWASATFTGMRHKLTFRIEGEGADTAADAFLGNLEETEFELRGHILADITLLSQSRSFCSEGSLVRISIEALTVEDG
jgi:hypothetical protein